MRAVGGHSVAERREGSGTPGSLVCSEDHMTGQATWPVSTGLRWPHRHVRGAGGTLPGAPGAGRGCFWAQAVFGGDENILELDSGDAT